MEILEIIGKQKVIAICRSIYGEPLLKLAQTLSENGLDLIEVTFDQSDLDALQKTKESIRMIKENCPQVRIGAGTVIQQDQLDAAVEVGCEYIISPNTDVEIIKKTKSLGLISIPGAMTPSEIAAAHFAGADLVKLFPAANLGIDYVKSVRAPLNHVKLLATGGVNPGNFKDFLQAGCVGAGISGNLCKRDLVLAGRFDLIAETAREYVKIAES